MQSPSHCSCYCCYCQHPLTLQLPATASLPATAATAIGHTLHRSSPSTPITLQLPTIACMLLPLLPLVTHYTGRPRHPPSRWTPRCPPRLRTWPSAEPRRTGTAEGGRRTAAAGPRTCIQQGAARQGSMSGSGGEGGFMTQQAIQHRPWCTHSHVW